MNKKSSRTTKPAPIPVQPQLAPDEDQASVKYAQQQESIREEAFHSASEQRWGKMPLNPWSRGRESLFIRLTDRDETGYGLDTVAKVELKIQQTKGSLPLEQVLDYHLCIEQAALVLFLAAHEPEEWDHLRGHRAAFLRAVTDWAETHIPLGQEWPAIRLAIAIRTTHQSLVPIREPSSGSSRSRLGN